MEFEDVAGAIYKEFSQRVYQVLRRKVEDHMVQDLHQEVFRKVFRYKKGQLLDLIRRRESGENVDAYLQMLVYGATKDVCADYWRRAKPPEPEPLDDKALTAQSASNPFDGVHMKEVKAKLIDALSQLSVKCREILRLRYMKELQYREIAEELNTELGTVKSMLNRCKKELRLLVEERYPELIID